MEQIIWLDQEHMNAFAALYAGDVSIYGYANHIAAGTRIDDQNAALMLCTVNDDALYIDWLFVAPEYRNHEVGARLLHTVLDGVTSAFRVDDIFVCCPDDETREYFAWHGFDFYDEDVRFRYTTTIGDLKPLETAEAPGNMQKLSDLTDKKVRILNQYFAEHREIPYTVPGMIQPDKYLPDSVVVMHDMEVQALLLLLEEDDHLTVPFAYAGDLQGKVFVQSVAAIRPALQESYGPDKKLVITTVNEDSRQLAEKLFPGAEKMPLYFGTREAQTL